MLLSLLFALFAGCGGTTVQEDTTGLAEQDVNPVAKMHTQLGVGYMREGKYDLAWDRLHKALEEAPDYSSAHSAMALLMERLNKPEQAETHFKKAVSLNPADSAAQNNYGAFLCKQGRYDEGEQRFLQALKNSLYNNPAGAYTNAGLCMNMAGDEVKAESYLRSALEINPRVAPALLAMSDISLDKERYLIARAYLQRYLEVGRHTPRSLWLGVRIERNLGDQNTAASYAMLLRSKYPDSREMQLLLESSEQ